MRNNDRFKCTQCGTSIQLEMQNTSLISFIQSYFLSVLFKIFFLYGKVDSLAQATNKI